MKISGKVGIGPMNKLSNFPDHLLDTGIVFWIH